MLELLAALSLVPVDDVVPFHVDESLLVEEHIADVHVLELKCGYDKVRVYIILLLRFTKIHPFLLLKQPLVRLLEVEGIEVEQSSSPLGGTVLLIQLMIKILKGIEILRKIVNVILKVSVPNSLAGRWLLYIAIVLMESRTLLCIFIVLFLVFNP